MFWLSPNDRVLVSGGYDCTIQLWDLESKKLLRALRKQLLPVTGLAISPDGNAGRYHGRLESSNWRAN